MKKKTWVVLTVCCSIVVGGLALANLKSNHADANSPTLKEKVSYAVESYEAQKKIADAPGATTEDEQRLKELATRAADLELELNPQTALEEFNEVFAGYKDLYLIHSAHYEDKKDSTDPLVQQVLHQLEEKGKLIAQFEKLQMSKSVNGESLLTKFYEETDQLNRELYPDRYKE
ncbi:hypothetical protein E6C60_3037 [Paenibacillus algicola]|uniref:Lipoprotein n=1 Tax=Paenibacillus algicola TaxID=2565926 RepID=A0A4P8XMH6_9BACL|nr:hypothetical protein [Paenibacillus algicola]QCT03748.1 hypothetical protein E6C60_3037 [Paenibacillus algicola]